MSLPGTVSVVVDESTVAVAVTDRAKDGTTVIVIGVDCPDDIGPRLQVMLKFAVAQPGDPEMVPETNETREENVR